MSTPSIECGSDGEWRVSGELSFRSVPELERLAAVRLPRAGEPWLIDLSAVTRADSAGLALLVEWLREARQLGVDIGFRNMPAQMRAMAHVSGLEDVLPLRD